jgi:pimeloyl-ACP methyl ester carboxylesterase
MEHDALDRLRAIRAPTLVVAGTDDRLTPIWHAEQLSRAIPGARLLYIPDAGHLPYVESPEAFQKGVLEFLQNESGRRCPREEEDPSCPSVSTPS